MNDMVAFHVGITNLKSYSLINTLLGIPSLAIPFVFWFALAKLQKVTFGILKRYVCLEGNKTLVSFA